MEKNKHFLPAFGFGVLLLIGASLPSGSLTKIQDIHRFFDIVFSEYSLHFFGFGIFAGFLAWGYHQRRSTGIFMKAGIISFSYGLLVEIIHYFLPYRSAELTDLALDAAGILFMLGLFWLIFIRRRM